MSSRINELFLLDIYIAILKIEFVSSKYNNSEDLKYDFISWDSIVREFEIIGEATKNLIMKEMISAENQIVVDFRNQLSHHYFGIDSEEVWDIIFNDLVDYKKFIEIEIYKININLKQELIQDISEENRHLSFIVEALEKLSYA